MTEKTQASADEAVQIKQAEREALENKARSLGIKFHPNLSDENLNDRIQQKLNEPPQSQVISATSDKADKFQEVREKATKLVRIRVTCMNPAKREWKGEIFTFGNAALNVKKFVPFGNTVWHVPQCILNMLKARKFAQPYQVKGPNGSKTTKFRNVSEFAVEVLEPLTDKELKELAQRQAMAEGTSEAVTE